MWICKYAEMQDPAVSAWYPRQIGLDCWCFLHMLMAVFIWWTVSWRWCMCSCLWDSHCLSLTYAGVSGTNNVSAILTTALLSPTATCWHSVGSVVTVIIVRVILVYVNFLTKLLGTTAKHLCVAVLSVSDIAHKMCTFVKQNQLCIAKLC